MSSICLSKDSKSGKTMFGKLAEASSITIKKK